MTYLSPAALTAVENLSWLDIEGTGLDHEDHTVVLELAAIVTDGRLNEIATFGPVVVKATLEQLSQMSEFVTAMHTKTGLVDKVLSPEAVSLDELDTSLAEFIAAHFAPKGSIIPAGSVLHTGRNVLEDEEVRGAVIAGSSVKYDLAMIQRYLPKTRALLDYRVVDSSSLREIIRRFNPGLYEAAEKIESPHEAMADIRNSLNEMRYYTARGLVQMPIPTPIADAA